MYKFAAKSNHPIINTKHKHQKVKSKKKKTFWLLKMGPATRLIGTCRKWIVRVPCHIYFLSKSNIDSKPTRLFLFFHLRSSNSSWLLYQEFQLYATTGSLAAKYFNLFKLSNSKSVFQMKKLTSSKLSVHLFENWFPHRSSLQIYLTLVSRTVSTPLSTSSRPHYPAIFFYLAHLPYSRSTFHY